MHTSIYQPEEDSYLLQESLINYLKTKPHNIKILDMGSGSGIQAKTCKKLGFKNITTADINPKAIKHLKNLNPIQSNLFSNIKSKFDLIIFNPPYLPDDKREPEESKLFTTAGKKGNEIILEFLKQATKHLKQNSSIFLLFSTLSKPKTILQKAKQLKYQYKKINSKKLFFEELFVYEIKIESK